MSERLMLKGALVEKKLAKMNMAAKAEGLIRAIKMIMQPASVTPLREVRTDEARQLIADLDDLRKEYLRLVAEIEEIERELG